MAADGEGGVEAPYMLRLKAAEFLEIAVGTRNPCIAEEARQLAERCIDRALELDRGSARPSGAEIIPLRRPDQRTRTGWPAGAP